MVNFLNAGEALEWLDNQGNKPDKEINLFEACLAMALQDHDGISVDSYRQHLRKLATDLEQTHLDITGSMPSSLEKQIQSYQLCFAQRHGYAGDVARYDNLENSDIIRVIDRRLGLPITLAILCIQIGREIGWQVHGLNFPGHFLVRLDFEGNRAIMDPFQSCKSLNAADMRDILKKMLGAEAELSSNYYEPASNRDILVRLHNNIKLRMIEAEHYAQALHSVQVMQKIMPDEYRLDLDAGVLQARLEQPMAAISSLQSYIDACPNPQDRAEAQGLIAQIQGQIN